MSSDDAADDSGFDKEAEREKLREKYEQDRKDRENTRRMSELLLQGATMTGKHCERCGDPIFRYDGREFCPTCQGDAQGQPPSGSSTEAEGSSGAAADPDDSASGADAADGADSAADAGDRDGEVEAGAGERGVTDDEPRVEIDDVRVADRHADGTNLREPPSGTEHGRRDDAADDRTAHTRGRRTGDPGPADLGEARAALVRKLTDLARSAEATDDVARSRDLLAATREAAEALAALDRANR